MVIHVVKPGDTLYALALEYGVPMSRIVQDNGLEEPSRLVVGQALVVRFPTVTHTVQPGDTLESIARMHDTTVRRLYQNNPILGGEPQLWPGQTIVVSFREEGGPAISVNGYAYPSIPPDLLRSVLPYLTNLAPFTYGFTPTGSLVELDDAALLAAARSAGVAPLMHLSTLTEAGGFSNELAHLALTDPAVQRRLIDNVLATLREKGYAGLDVDFEYVYPEDAGAYAALLAAFRARLAPLGLSLIAALAPKTSAAQRGALYEGHDFAAIGAAVDQVLLMTYEWGYTYGPPMAVAPLPNVRQVVEYALTEIPAEKIWLGVPAYGYDWPLPFVRGESRATSISPQQAVALARRYGQAIQYDQRAQAPHFNYTDERGVPHEVWFEDARSILAKLSLIPEYGLYGAGYWNLMRPFPQNWTALVSRFCSRPT